jgi:NTE family protein
VAISVFELSRLRTRVLETGPLNPAIRASCAFPGLFHPVRVENRLAIDGGVLDRSGLAGAPPEARILYHHLATRSKMRRHLRRLSGVPTRADMWPVVIDDLPRVGPNRLQRGPAAFAHARDATLRALDTPARTRE